MRYRAMFLASGLAIAAIGAAPAQADVVITVDKSTQLMTVQVDGATRWQWKVSTGRTGHDTPNGTFHALYLDANHHSKKYDDAPMPHSVFFTDLGHAIHGTFATRRLGMPASHGCVRLDPDNATQLSPSSPRKACARPRSSSPATPPTRWRVPKSRRSRRRPPRAPRRRRGRACRHGRHVARQGGRRPLRPGPALPAADRAIHLPPGLRDAQRPAAGRAAELSALPAPRDGVRRLPLIAPRSHHRDLGGGQRAAAFFVCARARAPEHKRAYIIG